MIGCTKPLIRGNAFMICEATPSGFGLCRVGAPFPIRVYPNDLEGWYHALADFHALDDKVEPVKFKRRRSA